MDRTYREEREHFLSETTRSMDEGMYDAAIALADARLDHYPGDSDAYLVKASCQARMGRPADAEEIIEQWYDMVRDQSRVYEVLGDAYTRDGMTRKAIEAYKIFVTLNADTAASEHISDKIASLQDREKDADESSEMSSDFHTITLARLYMKQGYFKMAKEVLDKILDRNPGNVEAREYAEYVQHLIIHGWGPVVEELDRWLYKLQMDTRR
mgnify:CR=1 FL=1